MTNDKGFDHRCDKSMGCRLQIMCERKVKTPRLQAEFAGIVSNTIKLNRNYREIFATLSFVPAKEEFSSISV